MLSILLSLYPQQSDMYTLDSASQIGRISKEWLNTTARQTPELNTNSQLKNCGL